MYLRKLTIENMKRIRYLDLDFDDDDGSPRMWTVIIGENGTAKTSILQAIAMSAAGPLRVNDLAGRLAPQLPSLKGRNRSMRVEAEYSFTELGRRAEFHPMAGPLRESDRLLSNVTLDPQLTTLMGGSAYRGQKKQTPTPSGVSRASLTPLDLARSTNAAHWFVAGYGVARDLPDAGYVPDLPRASIDRLRSLFDRRSVLTATSFIDILGSNSSHGKHFGETLRRIFEGTGLLAKDVEQILVQGQRGARDARGMAFRNSFVQKQGGAHVKVPMTAVAHGMQSTVAWISDFVGHILLEAEENIGPDEMAGLVLVDEIDLYIHPTLQVSVIRSLKRTFPRIQFVVTTHSPLILAGLRPDEDEIVRLVVDEATGDVVRKDMKGDQPHEPDPRTMTTAGLYQRYFGLDRIFGGPEGTKLAEYQSLANNPWRTDSDEQQLHRLRRELTDAGIDTMPPVERVRP